MSTVIGIDLSGPANTADTAAACFRSSADGLEHLETATNLGDGDILHLLARHASDVPLVVGLDAPLSYQPGGGDRPADAALRRLLVERGLASGSVMTPTMTRMAYLTLRGIAVARAIEASPVAARIVEVHPGGAMALRGAPAEHIRSFKSSPAARRALASWLHSRSLHGASPSPATDHEIAARACALAAWHWSRNEPAWCSPASGPLHPYDFAC